MATTIVRHYSEALLCEEQHLGVPHIGVQRPSVREGDDRTLAPVFVIDRRAILYCDRAHVRISLMTCLRSGITSRSFRPACLTCTRRDRERGPRAFVKTGHRIKM